MNLRRLFLIAVPLVAVAASVVIVGAGGGRSSVSAQSNATLALDMNPTNGDGPCNPIDAHASVARGSTFQVAICLTDAAEPPAAFNIELNYDNSVNECAPVECSDQLCFDGNPDANLGSTTWTDSGLGTACDCGSGGENPPTCDYNPGNDPNRTAFISCTCIETQTLPAGEGISGPIAMVTFKNVAEGSTDLAFGTVAFYPLQGPAMLRCPTAKCTGGSVDTNAASPTAPAETPPPGTTPGAESTAGGNVGVPTVEPAAATASAATAVAQGTPIAAINQAATATSAAVSTKAASAAKTPKATPKPGTTAQESKGGSSGPSALLIAVIVIVAVVVVGGGGWYGYRRFRIRR
jgi:hypothetical protein